MCAVLASHLKIILHTGEGTGERERMIQTMGIASCKEWPLRIGIFSLNNKQGKVINTSQITAGIWSWIQRETGQIHRQKRLFKSPYKKADTMLELSAALKKNQVT